MFHSSPNLVAAGAMAIPPAIRLHRHGVANVMTRPVEIESLIGKGNVMSAVPSIDGQIAYVRSLQEGWAGRGSQSVSDELIGKARSAYQFARSLLPSVSNPAIVPCADGSLQIEWHQRDSRFEMYFETDSSVSAWWHERGTDEEHEAEGTDAFVLLSRWAVRAGAWPWMDIAA